MIQVGLVYFIVNIVVIYYQSLSWDSLEQVEVVDVDKWRQNLI